jgi:hypothetical protein
MQPSATDRPRARVWPIVVAAVLFVLVLPASLLLAVFGLAAYNDSYSHDSDRVWALIDVPVAGGLLLASFAALLFLIIRKQALWRAAVGLLALSLAGIVVLMVAGNAMVADTSRRGGDWAAAGVLGGLLFGMACPALTGLLALGGGACLWLIRRPMAEAAKGHATTGGPMDERLTAARPPV